MEEQEQLTPEQIKEQKVLVRNAQLDELKFLRTELEYTDTQAKIKEARAAIWKADYDLIKYMTMVHELRQKAQDALKEENSTDPKEETK